MQFLVEHGKFIYGKSVNLDASMTLLFDEDVRVAVDKVDEDLNVDVALNVDF